MNKLRLDYYKSLGLKLEIGDVYTITGARGEDVITCDSQHLDAQNSACSNDKNRFIISFAPRKNTGEQHDCGDIPIIARYNETRTRCDLKSKLSFEIIDAPCVLSMESWIPDLELLIKMQDENDNKGNNMITEAEQKILDNAPDGAQYYYRDGHTDKIHYSEHAGQARLDTLRKKQGKSVVDASKYRKAELSVNGAASAMKELGDAINGKPRMKVEYIGVHNSEAIKGVMEGEDYYYEGYRGAFVLLAMNSALSRFCKAFKKVETEITWQDEAEKFGVTEDCGDVHFAHMLDRDEFITLCHLVSSMNK